jgi:hypothetical protein
MADEGKATTEQLQRHALRNCRANVRDTHRMLAAPNRSPKDNEFVCRINLAMLKMYWMAPYLTEEQRLQIRGMMNEVRTAIREHGIEMEEEPFVSVEGSNFLIQWNSDMGIGEDEDEDE